MNAITDIFLPLALAFIMFALGLGLTGADFLRIIKQPKDFFVGAISQIILLPIIAFLLVKIWPISPELAIGVMIIAAAPGGVTSNILTSFARGDVALSVSLTAVISLLSVITVPFIVVTSLGLLGSEYITQNIYNSVISTHFTCDIRTSLSKHVENQDFWHVAHEQHFHEYPQKHI